MFRRLNQRKRRNWEAAPPFKAGVTSARAAWRAGARPNSTVLTPATTNVETNERQSTCHS